MEDTVYVPKVLPHSPGRRANNPVHGPLVNDWSPQKPHSAETDNIHTQIGYDIMAIPKSVHCICKLERLYQPQKSFSAQSLT